MKTEKKMIFAFLLNLAFSVFEWIGGMITGSVAILSDAVHDLGDAVSIGLACFFEHKSHGKADSQHTYGYSRYSVLGGVITSLILLLGSALVLERGIHRLLSPTEIDYRGMVVFAAVGFCVNGCAALFTRDGTSVNQKAINLHMLEDVLGWAAVLAGAIVMHFTDFVLLDPILSIGTAVFILIHAAGNLKEAADLFLEKSPHGIDAETVRDCIFAIDGVLDVHHIHIRCLDEHRADASLHVVTNADPHQIKHHVREALQKCGIDHATIETETSQEQCDDVHCHTASDNSVHHGHHHHHHH